MMVIGELLTQNARRIPDCEAVIFGDQRLTWRSLNERVNRLANGLLAQGVIPGSRIAFLLGNCAEIVQIYYAIAKIGCVSVPILPRSVGREIAHIANDVQASVLFADAAAVPAVAEASGAVHTVSLTVGAGKDHPFKADFEELIAAGSPNEPAVAVDPDSIYAIIFTSGTTGVPKGCVLRHRAKIAGRMVSLMHVPLVEEDRAIIYMPLAASLGSDLLHKHALRGVATVLMPSFDEERLLELIERERVTLAYVIESTFDRLVAHPALERFDLGSLRYFLATSATRDPKPGMLRLKALKGFRARFWNSYGCTEGGGELTFLEPHVVEESLAGRSFGDAYRSIGREAMLCRVDCRDEEGAPVAPGEVGEMTISSPWMFSEYWNRPEMTAEVVRGGAYCTGDLARKDEHGFIYLEGRKKDMIKTGGLNVYPVELEMLLKQHPSVQEVAVIGVPDPRWGEKVVACIIPRGAPQEEQLNEVCRRELAGFKRPKSFVFLEDFPRDSVGKIVKRRLRDLLMGSE